jgi:hypothetical protein
MEDIRKGSCPLCAHNEIVEGPIRDISPLLLVAEWPKSGYRQEVAAAYAAFTYTASAGTEDMLAHGRLKRYACRRCGYTQSFCDAPQSIPIDDAHETRLIKGPEPAGPYR